MLTGNAQTPTISFTQHARFKLLNDTFRKSRLAQRLAVLQAAAWLIDVLEQFAPIV